MKQDDLPNCLDEESAAALFQIAVKSVTADNDTVPLDQVKALADKLAEFAEATLRQYSLLTLIEEGKVEPTLVDGELAFRIPK